MDYSWDFPYASRRAPVFAGNVVATSQPLATQAGLRILHDGGNAVDAAIATAIALTVVEPNSNGIGSDAFAIIWDGHQLHGLNASGRSPAGWSPDRYRNCTSMPLTGWDSVTVPGAVSAWVSLSQRFGKLPFSRLFRPAIDYARNGYQLGNISAPYWRKAADRFGQFPGFMSTFTRDGKTPAVGEKVILPFHANTLQEIAETNGESFYRGKLAQAIIQDSQRHNGAMTLEDLASHQADWVTPIHHDYRGYRLHEIPPSGQGLLALIALGILEHFEIRRYPVDSADSIHLQIESVRQAYMIIERQLADTDHMHHPVDYFLDKNFLADRAARISLSGTSAKFSPVSTNPDTVYLSAADSNGMMVSMIQSNYMGFGSGIVVPETGISMQNRGCGFTLEENHPNQVAGNKRPYHTIIPGFVSCNGQPVMSFGVMGGHMQAQGHLQMMVRIFDYQQNPQAASDAPRWQVKENGDLALESTFTPNVVKELKKRGHRITQAEPSGFYGGAQLIIRMDAGYCGASDHRKEGLAAGF
jgi:gamma-glutamyltranspeptidase/glutathione hydrolase